MSITDYKLNDTENESLLDLQHDLFTFFLQKVAIGSTDSEQPFMSIQDYFSITRKAIHTEKSKIAYLEVVDAIADCKDTQLQLLQDLFSKFIHNQSREYLIVEGDQKLFEVLQSLKIEYGKELDWVIPIPGDWHMLLNYHTALMKPYFDAGLKSLATAAEYPVAAIQACSQFKRTHNFLLEVWESLYRTMILMFLQDDEEPSLTELSDMIIANKCSSDDETLKMIMLKAQSLKSFEKFKIFIQKLGRTDSTWRFWIQFVFQDLMAYMGLFLAIRSGDWHLRKASIKQMAPIFSAFDHIHYRRLISKHLSDLLTMPQSILTMFEQGAFVVSVTGRHWHSVAIDECHEMLINKSCKTSIVRPIPDYISRIARYLPYRTKALENLSCQIFPGQQKREQTVALLSSKPVDIKQEHNISAQIRAISDSGMLQVVSNDRGLTNYFTNTSANTQQSYDLLNFRDIGQTEFLNYVSFYVLKHPSTTATVRKRRLQTLTAKKVNKQRFTQLEKDRNLILKCMRKKISWSLRTGTPIDKAGEQLIALPLAISDNEGNPKKGQKSSFTKALVKRYTRAIIHDFPPGWQLQCCLIDGMFLINTIPLGSHRTFGDYGQFLMQRHIIPHFLKGSTEVHLIFDNPQLMNTPKYFEQRRRDQMASVTIGHSCDTIDQSKRLPTKWRNDVLHCRTCKRTLVQFLADYMLNHIQSHIASQQKFFVAGAFIGQLVNTSWFVEDKQLPQPHPEYSCNAEEADTVLWLHATKTQCTNILVLSPDTDVYMIGLPLLCTASKHIIVQISAIGSNELKLLCTKSLVQALSDDPDLAYVPPPTLTSVLQTLFVVSGCDYISFFSGIGKASFLRCFFQHAQFITGNTNYTKGSLAEAQLDGNYENGFMAFLRLIGTAYFKKHAAAFDSVSPECHFKNFFNPSFSKQHQEWIDDVRQKTWDRSTHEAEIAPSTDALWRHWKRSCWVIDMWKQADCQSMLLSPLTSYGWHETNGILSIDWDSLENQTAVRDRVFLLTKGCKCKTGCRTGRCSCKKRGQNCSEGCSCLHCLNLPNMVTENAELEMDDSREQTELEELEVDEQDEVDFYEFLALIGSDSESEQEL